jgi:hypothetical protein
MNIFKLMRFSILAAACGAAIAPTVVSANGAAFTTINTDYDSSVDPSVLCKNGNPAVNCNIYGAKEYVWMNGGPAVAYEGAGDYFFVVLEPGGQNDVNDGGPKNLSDDYDAYTNRIFSADSHGVLTNSPSTHILNSNKIRLSPYADTPNPGGVYIMAICSLAQGYPVDPSTCKFDAFKIGDGSQQDNIGLPLYVTKDADASYTNSYGWNIKKEVDQTLVKQVGGTATFNYKVSVGHDAGAISDVKVKGTISVFNPNIDNNNQTVPVYIDGVSDKLSDNTTCTVTNGGPQLLTEAKTDFSYTCNPSAPTNPLDNTASVAWSNQSLSSNAFLIGGSADFTFKGITYNENTIGKCVTVTDTFDGTLGTLGNVCVGDANPSIFSYSRTVPVPSYDCRTYDNTAAFKTTENATGSANQSVKVCGPAKTGALTMGFWQNKNGQAIISGGNTSYGVCKSGTWLRNYAPFQDLSPIATCAQVATYVTNIIKAANASGVAMNAMLKAQMLATALDVYFSDPALGGNKINAWNPIGGITIDLTKVCKDIATCSIFENVSPSFGGAISKTVGEMLTYAASRSDSGGSPWYGQVKSTQELAKDAFDAINNQVAFAP